MAITPEAGQTVTSMKIVWKYRFSFFPSSSLLYTALKVPKTTSLRLLLKMKAQDQGFLQKYHLHRHMFLSKPHWKLQIMLVNRSKPFPFLPGKGGWLGGEVTAHTAYTPEQVSPN